LTHTVEVCLTFYTRAVYALHTFSVCLSVTFAYCVKTFEHDTIKLQSSTSLSSLHYYLVCSNQTPRPKFEGWGVEMVFGTEATIGLH